MGRPRLRTADRIATALTLFAGPWLGCALPPIQRESPKSAPDAGLSGAATSSADAGRYDPKWDPANRNEDFESFQALVPSEHIFAEWPMAHSAPGAVAKPSFSATDTIVTDNVTKLRWQRVMPSLYRGCTGRYLKHGEPLEIGSGCSWEEAKAYCSSPDLARQLGGGSWRLPTKIEAESLLELSRIPTLDPSFEMDGGDPEDPIWYVSHLWTASPTPNPNGLKLAWAVDYTEGYSYASARYKAGHVRCVSSTSATGGSEPSYDISVNVVTDWSTRLHWQRALDSETRTWQDAIRYCEALKLDDSRWRLPALKELLSIVDSRRITPAAETQAFVFRDSPAGFWTSTPFAGTEDRAFSVDFGVGESTYAGTTQDRHYVRCVR